MLPEQCCLSAGIGGSQVAGWSCRRCACMGPGTHFTLHLHPACPLTPLTLADGHLYELQYSASDSWRSKRCQKVGILHLPALALPGLCCRRLLPSSAVVVVVQVLLPP